LPRPGSPLYLLVLCLLVFFLYGPSLMVGFFSSGFDDDVFVTANRRLSLSWENLYFLFTHFFNGDYLPLTYLSLSLDHAIWGLNPLGYHLTNIMLHFINASLLYFCFIAITQRRALSLFAAALWAAHPVNVEAVVLVAQRKTLLAGCFFLLAFLRYRKFSTSNLRTDYFQSLFFFILSLAAKSTGVILPFLLLLYEYRFHRPRLSIYNKIPFLLLGLAGAALTVASKWSDWGAKGLYGGDLFTTSMIMAQVYIEYLVSLALPYSLLPYYAYGSPTLLQGALPTLGLAFLIGFTIYFRKKFPNFFFFIAWFFIALIPVSNLVPGATIRADRFLYIPSMIFALWLAQAVLNGLEGKKRLHPNMWKIVPALIILSYGYISASYVRDWLNPLILWERSLRRYPNHPVVLHEIGAIWHKLGDKNRALDYYWKTIQSHVCYGVTYNNAGVIYYERKSYAEAQDLFRKAIECEPKIIQAYVNLGLTYVTLRKEKEALAYIEKATALDPELRKNAKLIALMDRLRRDLGE